MSRLVDCVYMAMPSARFISRFIYRVNLFRYEFSRRIFLSRKIVKFKKGSFFILSFDQDTKIKRRKSTNISFFLQSVKQVFLQLTFIFEIPIDYSNKIFRLNGDVYYIIFIYP